MWGRPVESGLGPSPTVYHCQSSPVTETRKPQVEGANENHGIMEARYLHDQTGIICLFILFTMIKVPNRSHFFCTGCRGPVPSFRWATGRDPKLSAIGNPSRKNWWQRYIPPHLQAILLASPNLRIQGIFFHVMDLKFSAPQSPSWKRCSAICQCPAFSQALMVAV